MTFENWWAEWEATIKIASPNQIKLLFKDAYAEGMEEVYKKRWEYIKADPDGARALLLLLKEGKGSPDDFDTMVDRIIESRFNAAKPG